jgi:hypothetical protein
MILSSHGLIASSISQGVVPLLDVYGSASAAYSVRLLRTAYSGNAIRVRRSSDNTEQDIGFSSGNLDTTALTSFCSGTNGFVTTWYDQSGNGNNAIQTTASNQPQIVSSGSVILEGGKPFIEYTSTNKKLQTAGAFSISSPLQVIFVAKNTRAVADFPYYYDFQTNRSLNYYADDVTPKGLAAFAGSQINSGDTSTSRGLFDTLFNGSSSAMYKNNSLLVSGNTGTNGASGILYLGSRNNGGQSLTGGFQEFILYPSNQSANRTGISTNINSFYSIY